MRIIVDDLYCTVVNPRSEIKGLALVREVCRARPDGYRFMPRYRLGHWDGYISLMTTFNKFPAGLLSLVINKLIDNSIESEVVYTSEHLLYSLVTSNTLDGIVLRDYQVAAANTMLKAERGVAKMATNAGKTEVMAAIIKVLGCKTLVLVHRKELMYQAVERFGLRGLKDVGLVGDGIWKPDKITVCMIQTLSSRILELKEFRDNKLLLVDECHHLSSDQTMNVLQHLSGYYRFGVSGTPLKYDVLSDMKLVAGTGPIVFELSNKFLIEEGYSARPVVHLSIIENLNKKYWKEKYIDAYNELIVNNEERNKLIINIALQATGSVLILVNFIDHGNILKNMIPSAIFVHGSDTTEYRQQVIQTMREGKGIFISSPIFDEGIDIPALDNVIIAAGGKSYIKLLQRIGRGMRKKDGDNILNIYDFIDDTNKYLLNHSEKRVETYVSEGFDTKLV